MTILLTPGLVPSVDKFQSRVEDSLDGQELVTRDPRSGPPRTVRRSNEQGSSVKVLFSGFTSDHWYLSTEPPKFTWTGV